MLFGVNLLINTQKYCDKYMDFFNPYILKNNVDSICGLGINSWILWIWDFEGQFGGIKVEYFKNLYLQNLSFLYQFLSILFIFFPKRHL